MFKYCPYCGFKIDSQNKNGFQCPNCKKWTHYSSVPAVSVLVKVGDETLIVRRAIDPGKGEEDIVGGFLEYWEDPLDGAIGEFKEEVGVNLHLMFLIYTGYQFPKPQTLHSPIYKKSGKNSKPLFKI